MVAAQPHFIESWCMILSLESKGNTKIALIAFEINLACVVLESQRGLGDTGAGKKTELISSFAMPYSAIIRAGRFPVAILRRLFACGIAVHGHFELLDILW